MNIDSVWNHLVVHREEIWWALLFAVIIGLILEFLSVGSRTRSGIRLIKNKLAEHSVADLRKRIDALQRSRDYYVSFLSSDKALYLSTFQVVLLDLLFISIGSAILVFDHIESLRNAFPLVRSLDIWGGGFFIFAVATSLYGLRLTSLVTREKIAEVVAKIEVEISGLQAKLEAKI